MKIRTRFISSIMIVFLLSFSFFVVFLALDQSAKKRADLDAKLKTMAEFVAMSNMVYVWNMDSRGIEASLESFAKDRDIVELEIRDHQGGTMAKYSDPERPPVLLTGEADIVHESEKIGTAIVTVTDRYARDEVREISRLMILSGMIVLGLLAVSLVLLTNLIVRPIMRLLVVAKDMSEGHGDLTASIGINSKDEVGALSGYFDSFLDKLRGMVVVLKAMGTRSKELGSDLTANTAAVSASNEQIVKTMNSMGARTEHLSEEIKRSDESVNEVNHSIARVVGMIEDQASAVNQSSAAIEEMIANIANIEKATESKLSFMNDLSALAKRSEASMADNVSVMDEIFKSTEVISEMIGVIDQVASRTNLLAMNAAIEAAHAGEFGRGFSVVADEIRKLAEQTAENSKNISVSLGTIIDRIKAAAGITKTSNEVIVKIIDGIGEVASGMNETMDGLKEISLGNQQITEALVSLNRHTEEVRDSGRSMREATGKIAAIFELVEGIAEENSRGMEEVNGGLGEISKAIAQVMDLSSENAQNLQRLDVEMEKFKT